MIARGVAFTSLSAALAFYSTAVFGQDVLPRGTLFLSFDNDTFAKSDDDYTNGLQLGWVSGYLRDFHHGPVLSLIASGLNRLPLVNRDRRQRFVSYSLSHRMFTPSDTGTATPIPDDIPYSALLFSTMTAEAQDANGLDAFSFSAGIVGPWAGGKWLQETVHRWIGSQQPQGWDNQLHNELLLNLGYEHRWRLAAVRLRHGWGGDIIGQGGFTAGNLITAVTLGAGLRWGWGVPDDYAIPPPFFGDETIGSRPVTMDGPKRGVWFFALANGSLFANTIFFDGNTFGDSPSIGYDHYIARLYTGLHVAFGRLTATYGTTASTVPWDTPDHRKSQRYGRLSVTYT